MWIKPSSNKFGTFVQWNQQEYEPIILSMGSLKMPSFTKESSKNKLLVEVSNDHEWNELADAIDEIRKETEAINPNTQNKVKIQQLPKDKKYKTINICTLDKYSLSQKIKNHSPIKLALSSLFINKADQGFVQLWEYTPKK